MTTMFQGAVEEKVLGITRNNQSDMLSFKVNFDLINRITETEQRQPEVKLTKKNVTKSSRPNLRSCQIRRRVSYKSQDRNASALANWS